MHTSKNSLVAKLRGNEQETVLQKAHGVGDGRRVKVFEHQHVDLIVLHVHRQLEDVAVLGLRERLINKPEMDFLGRCTIFSFLFFFIGLFFCS